MDGALVKILAQEGETIPMGAPLAEVETVAQLESVEVPLPTAGSDPTAGSNPSPRWRHRLPEHLGHNDRAYRRRGRRG